MIDLDDIDRQMIDLLRQDARQSNRELGRRLGVSEGTIRTRLKRLTAQKALQIGMIVDPRVDGLTAPAYIGLRVEPSRISAVAKALDATGLFAFLSTGVGEYDVWGFALAKDREALLDLTNRKIPALKGVRSIDVKEPIRIYNHNYNWTMIA